MDVNDVTERIIGAGIAVHRALGPGLLESAYQMCLLHELLDRGLLVESDRSLPVRYKNVTIDCAYRIDMLVENAVIVELKSVARIDRIHVAQMLTYLKLTGQRVGLLINFNVPVLREGIRRIVLGHVDE